MNNDSTPISLARRSTSPTEANPENSRTASRSEDQPRQDDVAAQSSHTSRRRRKTRKVNPGFAKKLQFMTQLLKNLDTLVFAQLSVLYYMECSIFRLAIRAYPHHIYLSPQPDNYTLTMEAVRSQVVSVFLPNLICMLLHTFASLPTAGESHRGYLHGGIIVDFIGQKPPTSKFSLITLDLVILAIQCLMLAMHSEREKLRVIVRPARLRASRPIVDTPEPLSTQDYDAEERGVLRDAPGLVVDANGDMEMQPLNTDDTRRTSDVQEGRRSRRHSSSATSSSRTHLSDILSSGNGILGEFHILNTIRNATTDYETTAAHSLRTLGYTVTMTRIRTMRRLERNQR